MLPAEAGLPHGGSADTPSNKYCTDYAPMKLDAFDFDLPQDRIALRPLADRLQARMLRVGQEGLSDATIGDLPSALRAGDCLVFNNTKVIPARLIGRRGAAKLEVTLHKHQEGTRWWAFAKPARKCQPGDRVHFGPLEASVLGAADGGQRLLEFHIAAEDFSAALTDAGVMPLPPYIASQRPVDAQDDEDYQTIFAQHDGSVAAPTASLHFTRGLLHALEDAGVTHRFVTLHVGAGTFLPVKVDDITDHPMHAEWGEITPEAARALTAVKRSDGRLVAVGTTALRLIETACTEDGAIKPFRGDTDIFITPGRRVASADMLLTNFHLPKSTLFMLVAAFSGLERMKNAYRHAIDHKYRFYSYGDACLLENLSASADEGN